MIKGRKDSQFGGSFKSIGMIRNSSIKYDRVLQPLLKMLPQLDSYAHSSFPELLTLIFLLSKDLY
jgi:hypothetical protein